MDIRQEYAQVAKSVLDEVAAMPTLSCMITFHAERGLIDRCNGNNILLMEDGLRTAHITPPSRRDET